VQEDAEGQQHGQAARQFQVRERAPAPAMVKGIQSSQHQSAGACRHEAREGRVVPIVATPAAELDR
jgi:hypothetical protein